MILFPAIDLKDGVCVRLRQGDMERATVFNADPALQASTFADAGCDWLHVVDLNGAFEGRPVNAAAVETILDAIDVPVQLGGGIRDMATIEHWLGQGVKRVVLGTVAVKQPDLVRTACSEWPGQIAVGIDARDGRVAVEGWAETTELSAMELAGRFRDSGVVAIVYTDIERDGELTGPNLQATAALSAAVPIPVIASGGISSIADLEALCLESKISGAIVGRALYDGRIDLKEALAIAAEHRPPASDGAG